MHTSAQWSGTVGSIGNESSLAWDDHYLIGSERIDSEHRIFFDLIVSYHEGRLGGMSKERLALMLEEIVLYARFHFKSEENMMFDLGYPGLEAHRLMHRQLTERLGQQVVGANLGRYAPQELEAFLVDWFVHHVTEEDALVSAYVARSGGSGGSG